MWVWECVNVDARMRSEDSITKCIETAKVGKIEEILKKKRFILFGFCFYN